MLAIEAVVSVIEGLHDPRPRYSPAPIDAMNSPYPRIFLRIRVYDFSCAVVGAVIDDYPLSGFDGLLDYAENRLFDVLFLVARRRHNDILMHHESVLRCDR